MPALLTQATSAVIVVRPGPFLAIIIAAAVAATAVAAASGRGVIVPVVVVELLLGVVIGPHGFGFHLDGFVSFFSALGLALLFFFAGYEIDVGRIRGQPLRLALLGWGASLALGYALAGVLGLLGVPGAWLLKVEISNRAHRRPDVPDRSGAV